MADDPTVPTWIAENAPELADTELFKFSVKLPGGRVIKIDLLQDVDIEFDDLEQHLEQIPAQYVFWASIYSELKHKVTWLDKKISVRRRAVARTTIEQYKSLNIKLTDKQFGVIVDGDEQIIRLDAELALANRNLGKIYHMVEAIRMRSEHCRSLAGFKRQEREQSTRQT